MRASEGARADIDHLPIRDRLLYRIIVLLLLTLVPVYASVIVFLSQGRAVLSKEISSSMRAEIAYYLGQFEAEVDSIRQLASDLVTDRDLGNLAGASSALSDYEKTAAFNRFQKRLDMIKNSSRFIDSVRVHIFSLGRSINASSTGIGTVSEIATTEQESLMRNPLPTSGFLRCEEGGISMRLGGAPDLRTHRPPLYTIDVDLSVARIRSALVGSAEPRQGDLILFDDAGHIVLSSDPQLGATIAARAGSGDATTSFLDVEGRRLLYVEAASSRLRMKLAKYVSVDQAFATLRIYTTWFSVFTVILLLVVFPFAAYAHARINKPLKTMMATFARIERGDLDVRIEWMRADEFGYLFGGFNRMAASLRLLVHQLAEQRDLARKAELRQLQSQINPHFLYNSYFLLHRLIKQEDTARACAFSSMMGRYFRYITRSDPDEVSLAEETEHARIYVDIQAMRFEGRIAVEFGELPPGAGAMAVPPLILQPVIENAFEHGLRERASGGILRVSFVQPNEQMHATLLIVEDNGTSLDDAGIAALQDSIAADGAPHEVTGLVNIRRRLALRFGPGAGLHVERSPLGGVRTVITLPRQQGES